MRRTILASVAAFSLSAAIAHAQAGSTPPGGSTAAQSSPATHDAAGATPAGPVTISGCVERADQLIQSSANTLGTGVGSQDFALIKATGPGIDQKSPVGTSGSSATKGAASIGSVFLLDGKDEMLNPHVGHEVEIVGTRVASSHVDTGTAVPARAPLLRVQSVKMIARTCSR